MSRLIGLALLLTLAVPASATEPSSGKVSKASPKVTWTGQVHSLVVTATDTAGRPVSKTVRVRVAR